MKRLEIFLIAALAAVSAHAAGPPTFRIEKLPTSLAGEWLFRTGHDPAWSSPFRERHAWQTIQVPGCWQRTGTPGYHGHAWYAVRIFVPTHFSDTDLALDLGVVGDAEEVFVNGRLIGGRGAFPPHPTRAVLSPRLYRLPRVSLRLGELNELVVHVHSTGGCSGLLGPPPRIGAFRELLRAYVQRDMVLSAVAAFLLALAALQGALFLTHREQSAHLVFAAFLTAAALFFLTTTTWGPVEFLGEHTTYRVHVATLLGSVAALVGLVYRYLHLSVPIPLITVQAALVLGIAFAAVWPASSDLAVLVHVAQGTIVLLGPYLLLRMWVQARRRQSFARLALVVTFFLGFTNAVDIATQIGLLPRRSGLLADSTSLLGVLPFAMVFTLIFFQRWAKDRWGATMDAGGLLPREKFLQHLQGEMERARRNESCFSVVLLRLSVPEEPARVEALCELVGVALRRTLRQIDAFATVRPDTFAVLLADADERAAVLAVDRLRREAADLVPAGQPRPTIAAGVAQYHPNRPQLAHELFAEAEAALYAATAEGRNITATSP